MSADSKITLQSAAKARAFLIKVAMGGETYGESYVVDAVDRLLSVGAIDTDAVLGAIQRKETKA